MNETPPIIQCGGCFKPMTESEPFLPVIALTLEARQQVKGWMKYPLCALCVQGGLINHPLLFERELRMH